MGVGCLVICIQIQKKNFTKNNIKMGKCDLRDCCMFVGVLRVSSATVYKVFDKKGQLRLARMAIVIN